MPGCFAHPLEMTPGKDTSKESFEMKAMKIWMLGGLILLGAIAAGCGGGGARIEARSITIGQELIDLDAAYKQGVITEEEYNKIKSDILKGKR